MATYVISDIHGEYDMLMDLLEKISLQDSDTLYVIGDVLDRGPHPIKTLRKLMVMPNVICLVGNHELMALESLKFLMQEITTENIKKLILKCWTDFWYGWSIMVVKLQWMSLRN